MATFKDVSTFRRSEVWDYFKFSWGCLLLVVRVLADRLLFLNLLFNSAVLLLVTEQLLALDLSCEFIYFYYFPPILAPPPRVAPWATGFSLNNLFLFVLQINIHRSLFCILL